MYAIQFTILPPPEILRNDIECVRIAEYSGEEGVAIKVSPNGVPGMVFHQSHGHAALEQIITPSGHRFCPPPLISLWTSDRAECHDVQKRSLHHDSGDFQAVRPQNLLGINASTLAPGWAELQEFGAEDLTSQLMEASNSQQRMTILTSFFIARLKQEKPRDMLVEESLRLIHTNIGSLDVKDLLDAFHLSERQFERRFTQTVGLSPHVYLRVKRFNEAIRLIKTRRFERLTDVAAALNFFDQSHFIRDIKAFSGMTPTGLAQQVDDFYHDQTGYSFV